MNIKPIQTMRVTFLGANTKIIKSTAAATSDLIDVRWLADQNLSLEFMSASATGTSDVKIEYKTALNAIWDNAGYWREDPKDPLVTPSGAAAVTSGTTTETLQKIVFSIEGATKFIAIVVTGINSNPADTVFKGKIIGQ